MKKILMLGVLGMGMSRLAHIYVSLGYEVVGIDLKEGETASFLRNAGVLVNPREFREVDKTFDRIVYSSAVPMSHPYIQEAIKFGIPVLKRGEALAEIVNGSESVVVAGTHGKTTTTSLITEILSKRYPVNAYIGGEHPRNREFNKDAKFFVVESDESDKTFLLLKGLACIVTNIDKDHLNSYDWDFEKLKDAFLEFMKHFENVFVNKDDLVAFEVSKRASFKKFYYSIRDRYSDAFVEDFAFEEHGLSFRLNVFKEKSPRMKLRAYGVQNLSNALAAVAVGRLMGLSFDEICEGISSFEMPKRRLEFKGVEDGVTLFDDHADHPTEVEATLNAIRSHFPLRKIIAVFQPHRYTRVFALKEAIAKPFYIPDYTIVLPIYSAFEKPIEGITDELVFKWIKEMNPQREVFYAPDFDSAGEMASSIARPGFIVVTLGPGDVYFAIEKIRVKLRRGR